MQEALSVKFLTVDSVHELKAVFFGPVEEGLVGSGAVGDGRFDTDVVEVGGTGGAVVRERFGAVSADVLREALQSGAVGVPGEDCAAAAVENELWEFSELQRAGVEENDVAFSPQDFAAGGDLVGHGVDGC